jgi:hypothetical protein
MRIESRLNKEFFRESQKINLNFVFKKKIKDIKQNLLLLLLLLVISYQLILREVELGYILFGFGLMFLINIVWFYFSYSKIKKQHFINVESKVAYYQDYPEKVIVYEFRDDDFYYKDYKMEFTLIWEKFDSFQLKSNYLVLKSFGGNYLNFFFNKEDIGSKDFDKIISIVRNKIKK